MKNYLGTILLPSRIESNNGNSSDGDSLTPPNFLPMYKNVNTMLYCHH